MNSVTPNSFRKKSLRWVASRLLCRPIPVGESNDEMLKAVLDSERRAIMDYPQRVNQAEEFGDKGLVIQLEDTVADETAHVEETEHILRDWTES